MSTAPAPGPATERLQLRRFRPSDRPAFAAMCADPEVMRHVGRGLTLSALESERALERLEDHWRSHGFGLWALQEQATGAWVGMAGAKHVEALPGEIEIGWRLARAHWGSGLGTEAALAARDDALRRLARLAPRPSRLIALVRPDNARSLAILDRLGMRRCAELTLMGGPAWMYELRRVPSSWPCGSRT